MLQITNGNSLTEKALGKQKIKNAVYRPFLYSQKYTVDDGMLLYNFLTGDLVFLDKKETLLYNNVNSDEASELRMQLIENWFLVTEDNDDVKLSEQVFSFMRIVSDMIKNPPITSYTIFTTTDCNARCFYCFELSARRVPMSAKTAEDVADYIIKKCAGNKVTIRWFGGEPLYNSQAIDIICEKLSEANVEFASSMVSNGYLFGDENVKKAKEKWNVGRVQITLDGTEEVYNRIKAFIYKDGTSAFKRVIGNIEKLLKNDIYVTVRMNIDNHNIDDMYALVDYLAEKFIGFDKFRCYAHLLFEDSTKLIKSRTDAERHLLQERFTALEKYIEAKGFYIERSTLGMVRYKQCMADNNASTTILPDGNLGKCEHYTEDHFWGSIYSDEVNDEVLAEFKELLDEHEECKTCKLKPMCFQLKGCPDLSQRCDEYDRKTKLRYTGERVLTEYKYYLAKKENYNET